MKPAYKRSRRPSIGRITEKDVATLNWNDIRSAVQAIANLRAKQARERALNRILPDLQREFERRLGTKDQLVKLTPKHVALIEQILAEELDGSLRG